MAESFEPIGDYRGGHSDRGGKYDSSVAGDPFGAYMTAWETWHVAALLQSHMSRGVTRCLDFACGTGRMTTVLGRVAQEVVGVDISESMITEARKKLPSARFVVADLTSEGVDLGTFDLVSSFRFFGNAETDLRIKVLRELNRRMKDGAFLMVNNHRNPAALINRLDRAQGVHVDMDLTPAKFKRLLREAGFEIVTVRPIGVWMVRHALVSKAGSRPELESRLESLFASAVWAPLAPDAVILAKKVRASA
ncbi:MAG TPA: class I SAM-dependent methyltransferase [Blastocatellia bacterium]|nr:class I SAM-dependent methyltransferase [Blastocatellia bacterium]